MARFFRVVVCLRRQAPTDESILQKAFKQAVEKAGLVKRATCHILRHSFAAHLLEQGYDMRTLQELLVHKDIRTPMVYAHSLNRGGQGVKSPMDDLGGTLRQRVMQKS